MSERRNYLTLTALHTLRAAAAPFESVWGEKSYLVGSVLERADFRDVDVRLILPDKRMRKHFRSRPVLLLANLTASAYLEHVTGLPIDFQYQSRTEADEYAEHERHPLMTVIGMMHGDVVPGRKP